MGPLRRQLTLMIMLVLATSPAMAEVCETMRPDWSADDGPATAVSEVIQFLIWGGGAFAIVGLLVGLYLRKAIILHGVMVVTLIMAVPYLWPIDPTARNLATAEGCVGPATFVTVLLGVIWVAALAGTLLKRKAAA